MYSIQEYLETLSTHYNSYLNGQFLSELLQFKGQYGVGNTYISKVFRAQSVQVYQNYEHVAKSVASPTYTGFITDNIARLALFNAAQRLIVAYQAAPGLIRQGRPNSMNFLFTQIMNDGAFKGTLRGFLMNLTQTSLVLWPSIFMTNQSKGGYFEFLSSYLFLDTILHPIDTIKNRMYSRTIEPQGLKTALGSIAAPKLFSGVIYKMLFNIPFATAIYSTTQKDENSWAYWLATAAAFPLQNLKVLAQTSERAIPSSISYRGVLPYMLLNYLAAWKLTALFSEQVQADVLKAAQSRSIKELGRL